MRNIHGFLFRAVEIHTPVLDFCFKKVTIDYFLNIHIEHARKKLNWE